MNDRSHTARALDRYLDAPSLDTETMTSYISRYLAALADQEAEGGKQSSTVESYQKRLRGFDRWMQAQGYPFSRRTTAQFLAHLQADGKRPRTIRSYYSAIRGYARWLELSGIEPPVLEAIKLPRLDQPDRVSPTNEQVQAIFAAIRRMPQHNFAGRFRRRLAHALFSVFAYCGCRMGVVLRLLLRDYRQDRAGAPELILRNDKGGQSRRVPVNADCAAALQEWLEIRAQALADHGRDTDALWLNSRYHPLGYKSLTNLWAELLECAGLTGSGIVRHSMRHWSVSKVESVAGLKAAQAFAGHRSIQTTIGYLHSDPQQVREAADALVGFVSRQEVGQRRPVRNAPRRVRTAR